MPVQEAEAFAKEQGFGTDDLMEIALKITQLPKKNSKRPRIAIITHGQNPVLLAKGNVVHQDCKITRYTIFFCVSFEKKF